MHLKFKQYGTRKKTKTKSNENEHFTSPADTVPAMWLLISILANGCIYKLAGTRVVAGSQPQ